MATPTPVVVGHLHGSIYHADDNMIRSSRIDLAASVDVPDTGSESIVLPCPECSLRLPVLVSAPEEHVRLQRRRNGIVLGVFGLAAAFVAAAVVLFATGGFAWPPMICVFAAMGAAGIAASNGVRRVDRGPGVRIPERLLSRAVKEQAAEIPGEKWAFTHSIRFGVIEVRRNRYTGELM
ncbi:hypothetical protein [Glycomyces artemisiae]|uniref:Uncharacterized protein n=1 Tax=Glycomyces artemisiae TaxID=1076443 RepID=A0A2T0UJ03_9ACTN|nr:hypothetical protein [Glycomyces artemisiae]PRY57923.1 hypothetical protein B0I28_106346 [Glycomyces artemisiae]